MRCSPGRRYLDGDAVVGAGADAARGAGRRRRRRRLRAGARTAGHVGGRGALAAREAFIKRQN